MQKLNFPAYEFKLAPAHVGQISKIFDSIRRKYVVLTPEEWVRQHLVQYLVRDLGYPAGLISLEKEILVNNLSRRPDLVVFDNTAKQLLVAECKAPHIKITQRTFDQAARYNLTLEAKFFVLTNGLKTYCCTIDSEKKSYHFLEKIPAYPELIPIIG